MRRLPCLGFVLCFFLIWAAPVQAFYMTPPEPVPTNLPPACVSAMEGRFSYLLGEHRRIEAIIGEHEAHCASVLSTDDALIESCLESQDKVEQQAAEYLEALDRYAIDLKALLEAGRAGRDAARYETELEDVERRLVSAKTEMSRINSRLTSYQVQIQEWSQLADKARQEAVDTARTVTIDLVTSHVLELGKVLSVKKFSQLKRRLGNVEMRLAQRNQERFEAVRTATAKRTEKLNDTATFIVFVQAWNTAIDQFYAADSIQHGKDREEVLNGLLDLTSSAGGIAFPHISYLTADIKILAALAGGWHSYFVARKNIGFLLELSETDLKLTTKATARVMEFTRSRLRLETRLQNATLRRDSAYRNVDCP